MAKGAAIKYISYEETVPKLLSLIKLEKELKKYDKIVLKPFLQNFEHTTPVEFIEAVLKYVMQNKNPVSEVFIAEGADGEETIDLFDKLGYTKLAEKYSVGIIDLNTSETQEVEHYKFERFQKIQFPRLLLDSFVISLTKLSEHPETEIKSSLSNMLGAFPASHYKGFFSSTKNKIRKWPIKYSIHDIIACKMPNFAIIDNSEKGSILAGLPLDVDKQAAKILGKDWKNIAHIKLADESFSTEQEKSKLY